QSGSRRFQASRLVAIDAPEPPRRTPAQWGQPSCDAAPTTWGELGIPGVSEWRRRCETRHVPPSRLTSWHVEDPVAVAPRVVACRSLDGGLRRRFEWGGGGVLQAVRLGMRRRQAALLA